MIQSPPQSRFGRPAPAVLSFFVSVLSAVLACLLACTPKDEVPLLPADAGALGRAGAWQPVPAGPPPNIVLITLDTTRRDHLSCYQPSTPATTPSLDALAAEAILFERAVSPAPITLPTHATILTGLYPYSHGARNNGTFVLSPERETLAEVLKARGYATGAVVGAYPVAAEFGLNQGFDSYDDAFPASSVVRGNDAAQRRAAEVTDRGLAWLDAHAGGPHFLWLHYFDPHSPYDPPEPYRSTFPGDPYRGEIAYTDAQVGRLLDGLRASEQWSRTVVVVAADHGESLGEHGERTHAFFIYGATQRVPLLLRLPDGPGWSEPVWRGRKVEALTSLADIFPTLLNLAGVPEAERPAGHGLSLLPVIAGNGEGHTWAYAEAMVPELEHGLASLRGLQTARWKYIAAPREELYDLVNDPQELTNLAAEKPEIARALAATLTGIARQDPGAAASQVEISAETRERLRSLGYLGSDGGGSRGGRAVDPKDRIRLLNRIEDARALTGVHRHAPALAIVDSVLQVAPDDPTALRVRGTLLVRLGRGEEAIPLFDRLLRDCGGGCPDAFELERSRTMALLAAGRMPEALAAARRLAESEPDQPNIHLLVGEILRRQGDLDGARRAMRVQLERTPDRLEPRVGLAELETAAGNREAARRLYLEALQVNPTATGAMIGLGELLLSQGQEAEARGWFDAAYKIDPELPEALFRRGWFFRREGKLDLAQAAYQAALERAPNNSTLLYNLGNICLEKGELQRAVDLYQATVRTGRVLPGLLLNLGLAQARLGDAEAARSTWEQALRSATNPQEAEVLRRNLQSLPPRG